jgi:hypothetical protein
METLNTLMGFVADGPRNEKAMSLLGVYRDMADLLDSYPPSRELSLAKTNLEQSALWAFAALSK